MPFNLAHGIWLCVYFQNCSVRQVWAYFLLKTYSFQIEIFIDVIIKRFLTYYYPKTKKEWLNKYVVGKKIVGKKYIVLQMV